jgi:hypothetical protein
MVPIFPFLLPVAQSVGRISQADGCEMGDPGIAAMFATLLQSQVEMKELIQAQAQRDAVMGERLAQLDQKLDSKFESIDIRVTAIEDGVKTIGGSVEKLTGLVNDLSRKFDDFKGHANETLVREEVKRRYGDSFCRQFVVQGLYGLVRLALQAKRFESPYRPRDLNLHSFSATDKVIFNDKARVFRR